ncbi:MAG: DUF4097 domain-containing protein [Myxococcales bacterium]|nr:DUF4097 domain-containing protein [Myxococcales bacterium]
MRTLWLALPLQACIVYTQPQVISTTQLELDVDDEIGIDLRTGAGDLQIVGESDRSVVEMEVTLVRHSSGPFRMVSDADAEAAMDLRLDDAGDRVSAEATLDLEAGSYALDVVLYVPASFDMDLRDTSGDIELANLAALVLDDSSGDVRIEDVPGAVQITDSSGELDIARTGPLDIDDSSGEIDVVDVIGDVVIDDDSGEIDVADVTGSVFIEDDSGEIDVAGVGADVDIDDTSGDIEVRDVVGVVTIRDTSGDITTSNTGDTVVEEDSSGEITIQ